MEEPNRPTIEQARAAWDGLSWWWRWGSLEGTHHETRFRVWVTIATLEVSAYAGDVCVLKRTACRTLDEALALAYQAWVAFPDLLPPPRAVEPGEREQESADYSALFQAVARLVFEHGCECELVKGYPETCPTEREGGQPCAHCNLRRVVETTARCRITSFLAQTGLDREKGGQE